MLKFAVPKRTILYFAMKKIYFKNDNGIYRVSLTGKESAELIVKDSKVGNFVIDEDNIYYLQTLKRMR